MELLHNTEAERLILGAIFVDNDGLPLARETLRALDFFHLQHRQIFEAMLALGESGKDVDLVSVKRNLEAKGQLESSGGGRLSG